MDIQSIKDEMIKFLIANSGRKEAVRMLHGALPNSEPLWFATTAGEGPKQVSAYIKRSNPSAKPIYLATLWKTERGYIFEPTKLKEYLRGHNNEGLG